MSTPVVLGIVSYKVFPAQMGGQKCVVDFYAALSKQTKVLLAVANKNKKEAINLQNTQNFLFNHWLGFLNILWLPKLVKLINKEKVSVIIIEHSYFGFLAYTLRVITKKPFIIRNHNIEAQRLRDRAATMWGLYAFYERWCLSKANKNFFVSEADLNWAIKQWKLDAKNCHTISYGTTRTTVPSAEEKAGCRRFINTCYNLTGNETLFFFNGTLDYLPNADIIRLLLTEIIPLLHGKSEINFRILICGKGLSEPWQRALDENPYVIYTGFVDDVEIYYEGTDCLLLPSSFGTGLKTKIIDSLASNQFVIATKNGAKGLKQTAYKKLIIVDDYDWQAFVAIMANISERLEVNTDSSFFEDYNWNNIATSALQNIQDLGK